MATNFNDFGGFSNGDIATVGSPAFSVQAAVTNWTRVVQNESGATGGKVLAFIRSTGGTGANVVVNDTIGATTGDIEVVGRFKIGAVPNVNYPQGPALIASTNACYGIGYDGTNFVLCRYGTGGASSGQIGVDLIAGYTANTYVWARIGRSGSTIRAKVWTGTAGDEPGGWGASGTDTVLTSVKAGLISWEFGWSPYTFDVLGVGTAGDTAPSGTTTLPAITDAGDEQYFPGETGVVITGTGFGSTQGAAKVYLSPTNNIADVNRVEQTITAWGDTSATITVVRGSLSFDTALYLFVQNNAGQSNATGYVVQLSPRVFIRENLIALTGAPQASITGITALVYHAVPTTVTANERVANVSSNGSGAIEIAIARGALSIGAPVWLALFKDGGTPLGGLLKVTPVYE